MSTADWKSAFDERAGILEYDAGFARREAEDRAWTMTIEACGEPPSGLTLEACRR